MNQDVKFDFFVEELTADEFYFTGTNETFSRSGFTLIMERSPTPFFMNTYIPTALLTLSSFIGFLIPVDMVPGRMAVLVTTFLMLVNISSTERDRGPEVRLGQEGNGRNGPKDERAKMIMSSEVRSDLRIELCDLNYHVI